MFLQDIKEFICELFTELFKDRERPVNYCSNQ